MKQDKMKNLRTLVPSIFLLLLFLSGFKSYGTDGIIKAAPLYGKNHQIAKDSIIYVADTILNDGTLRAGWTVRKVRNVITFKLDEFANLAIPDTFQITLKFRFTTIKWIYSSNQPATAVTTTADSTLYINFDKNLTYNSKAVLVLPDVFSSSVKIVSVSVTDTTSNKYKSLMVENEIQVSKEYTSFDCSNNAVQTINQSTSSVATDGELKVFWSPATGADEYDLEWNYIDSSAVSNYYLPGTSTFDAFTIFDNNASRVSISNESYNIPLLYDNTGKLLFRVRSVQITSNGQRVESNWSSGYSGGLGSYDFTGHERKLNWQAKTSFAEEGKRKSVIQYFDGSLRNRQTVTKDNTTDTTIVAETFYDNQGRPVIQVLPSPSLERIIKYNPGFNASINSTEYDKTYYDDLLVNVSYCDQGAAPMGTQSGSSQYYSPQNQNVNNGYNRFIPDAKGYPFTETKYTQDNTGRISAQSGVGPHHQLGQTDTNDPATKNHETKYYYGSADQEDLDALFGTEAGNYTHYFKNMVRDANGQYSVSYIDMHGRTVATALAGTPLNTSLELLPSNVSKTVTKKLLDSNNNIIRDNSIEAIKTLVVTKSGDHYFDYSLSPESLQLNDCDDSSICYDCLYDLTITVTDNCNNQNLPGGIPHVISRKNFTIPQPDTTCTNAAAFNVLDTLFNLPEGVYAITKKLEISKYGMDYYRDSIFLKHNTCTTLDQFIAEQKQIILNNLNCGLTCQQCSDSLGTWEEFRVKYMQKLGISSVDSADYRGQAYQSYTDQLADCDLLCDKHSALDDLRTNMLADMTGPFGQYANDAGLPENDRDYYSIYNRLDGQASKAFRYMAPEGNIYYNADGSVSNFGDDAQPIFPVAFSPEKFDDNFKSSWAESLLKYHPEYGKYKTLAKLSPSLSWNEKFGNIETFREAYDSGYLNPTGNTSAPFNKYPVVTANVDPFYQNELDSFQTNNFKGVMESFMQDLDGPGANNSLSIWAAVSSMSKCDLNDGSCLANYSDGTHAFDSTGTYSLCTAELDIAWKYFREMYLNKKRTETNDFINTTATVYPSPSAGHVLHFQDVNSLMAAGGPLSSSVTDGENQLAGYIYDNCTASALQWWRELAPCNYSSADSAIIIPRLIAVCAAGGDATHPFGSRTIKPGSSNTYKSFEEVIKDYNLNHSPAIPYNSSCNAELIAAPEPYDQQLAASNMEIWTKPDSCTCASITMAYNQYLLSVNIDTSFAAYVNRVNGVQMTESDLQTLRGMCNNTSTCSKLSTPIVLPPSLQCGLTNSCVSCVQVKNLTDSFNVTFPNTVVTYDENDSSQRVKNHLFENYMNHRLGFSKTAQQYLDFIDTCTKYSLASCDSLQAVLKSFVQNVKSGRVTNALESEFGGPIYQDLHQMIDNGTIHFPDSIRQVPSSWYNNYGITMSNFCTSNGYIAEVKFKFLADSSKTGDIFYSGLAPASLTGDRFSNGLYAKDSLNTYYLLDPNPKAQLNWMILKAKVTPTYTYYYYNNNFIYKWPNYSSGDRFNFGLGLFYRQGCIDYIKISDTLGNVKYFEDYNDPDYPATVDPSFICPAPPDCQTAFTNYYNSARGTSYTFSQLDSIYQRSCGKSLDVCSNNNVSAGLCDTLSQISQDFNGRFLNKQGADSAHFIGSSSAHSVQPPITAIFTNGIAHIPDSLSRLNGFYYDSFTKNDTLCVTNDFTIEYRFKKEISDSILTPTHLQYDFNEGNAYGKTGVILAVKPNRPLNYTDSQIVQNSATLNSIPLAYNGPGTYSKIPTVFIPDISNWVTVKLQHANDSFYVYFNDSLLHKIAFSDSIYRIFKFQNIFSSAVESGSLDYIKVYDKNNMLQYVEEFEDCNQSATNFPASLSCSGNCQTAFVSYYNSRQGTSYNFAQIDSIYETNCGTHPKVCGDTLSISELHLCGKSEPAFPVMLPTQWNQCDDSTNFAISKGTQLYEASRDSLNNIFDGAYRQKCLNAQKLESFTVTAPVSEYHYTLYYYGQAGNLIKTVPPQGVDLSKFDDAGWSASVAAARKNNQLLTPAHGLRTIYRYNTLNQVVGQYTPDAHKSQFWYDRLGRLAISQNAKQQVNATENGRRYSYTLYDYIGRITEVGEYINPSTTAISQNITRDQNSLASWLATQANRSQITTTVYDLEYPGWVTPNKLVSAKNLRNRVSYTSYTIGSNPANFNQATFYTYDILGNVDTLIQDYGNNSAGNGTQNMMNVNNNRWKKIVYRYDLISGKVNHVAYQPQYINAADNKLYMPNDAMYHKYEYDAENRLTAAYTSMDSVIWEKDARYEYYKHGPLARTTIGDQLVQGMDYAYTLQGWLKGVNSTNLDSDNDMGGDGNGAAGQDQNKFVAKDVMSFNLNYYTSDYVSIKNTVLPFPVSNSGLNSEYRPLYNGNISSMAVNIKGLNKPGGGAGAMLYNYRYDQLNRLTGMDAYIGLSGNTWTPVLRNEDKERIAYDGNGNILKYLRNGNNTSKIVMDSLSYKYNAGTNQLNHVRDNVPAGDYTPPAYADLDDQATDNYGYDEIGNLIKDDAEGVTGIEWNVYGKIMHISFSSTTVGESKNVYFYYDAAGNRVGKRNEKNSATGVTTDYVWQVRDASGNVMAIYSTQASSGYNIPTSLSLKERHLYGSSRLGISFLKKDAKTIPSFTQTTPYKLSWIRGNKSYELTNHLGNVLSTVSDIKFGVDTNSDGMIDYYTADVVGARDYLPFGNTMPARSTGVSYRYEFNGKEKDREGPVQFDYGARIYDPRLGRFRSVDPLTSKFPSQSPYIALDDNPINKIDPDGMAARPQDEFDQNGKKISELGGNKIDFYHQTNGDTKIIDRQTGASNSIVGGEKLIRNYTLRDKSTGWGQITKEFFTGKGPTNSLLADFDNSNEGAFGSLHSNLSSYSTLARKASLNSTDAKGLIKMNYGNANPFLAQDMWEQMWGRSDISWYKLGGKTLFLMNDSKSWKSLTLRAGTSWERSEKREFGNTYQTYIWIESNADIQSKVIQNNAYYQKQVQQLQQEIRMQKF